MALQVIAIMLGVQDLVGTAPGCCHFDRLGGYPGLAGGPWLRKTLVPPGLRAVVVPSGASVTVQPHW